MNSRLFATVLAVFATTTACGGSKGGTAPTSPSSARATLSITSLTVMPSRVGSGYRYDIRLTIQNSGSAPATLTSLSFVLLFGSQSGANGSIAIADAFTSPTLSAGAQATSAVMTLTDTSAPNGQASGVAASLAYTYSGGADTATRTTNLSVPTTFTLSGRVTDSSGAPIAGAAVRVQDGPNAGRSTTTDSNGNFTLADLQPSGFTVTATASGFNSLSLGVDLTSNKTQNFQLARSGPRTSFATGTHLVNTDIAPGRYFSDPSSGCYWERLRGLSGSLSDIIANEFVSHNAAQLIVDIAGSDRAFKSDSACLTWFRDAPRHGAQSTTPNGVWLVGSQIAAGTYRVSSTGSCYWERLRGFSGELNDIIANDFIAGPGQNLVELRTSDVGFNNDGCGTWSRITAADNPTYSDSGATTLREIERNRFLRRQRPD